jgi:hypothetical protein
MKIWTFACGVACITAAMTTAGMAQSLIPVVDIAPHGAVAVPPFVGALPPDEIIASVRSAGFDPVSRPVHRGGVYVLFAIDRYDVDVRLTVDAHSGRVLSAMRLAGEFRGEPGYRDDEAMPRASPPGYGYPPPYEPAPQFYERAVPAPPADVPAYGPGYGSGRAYGPPPIAEGDLRLVPPERGRGFEEPARRARAASTSRPPLPRTRPGDIVTGAAKEAARPLPSAPQAAPPAAPAGVPVDAPAPQQPGMVPIAPLE